MRIGEVGSTSNDEGCPRIWATDRGTLVIQGTTVTDPEALEVMRRTGDGLPDYESAVEVPSELLPFIALQALENLPFSDAERRGFNLDPAAVEHVRAVFKEIAERATAASR